MSPIRRDLVAAVLLTAVVASGLAALSGLPVWPGVLVWLGMVVGAWPARREHHGPGIGWANGITLARCVMVGLVAAWTVAPPPDRTLLVGVAALAFALDGLDGFVARRTRRESALGARLDMELDAVMVVVLGLAAWRLGHAGPWVLLAGAWRYLFVLAGRWLPWLQAPLDPFPPRAWACGLCVGGLILSLALSPPLATAVAALAVGVVTLSFLRDTRWLWLQRRVAVAGLPS